MFRSTHNLETAFRQIRLFALAVVAGSILLCGFTLYKSYKMISEIQGKIYVLSNGKALEALAEERKDNIPVEARDHVSMFHRLFFTLSPDEAGIRQRIGKALYFADASAKKQYDDLSEKGYYAGIVSGNISQDITIDSVSLLTDQYPFFFRCYATQQITRPTSIVMRSLITEGYLRNIERSDNNPHGFLIEKWTTIDNKDIKVINR